MKKIIKNLIRTCIRPNGKMDFISRIQPFSKVLDVGCGSHGATKFKQINKDILYYGIDIQLYNYNNSDISNSDELILTSPELFADKIGEFNNYFDYIVCAHNLEHCNNYLSVTLNCLNSLKKGGKIYFSFPSEASIHFPKRNGCLNFYDDPTHINLIPFQNFINYLNDHGLKIQFYRKRYRPFIPFIIGLIFEPWGLILKKKCPILNSTWALYGFESVIIGQKL